MGQARACPFLAMDVIELDGADWTSKDDFYTSYLAAVGAPEWHGRNLDALWDSLTAGGMNQHDLPFRIRITGTERMTPDARRAVDLFEKLIRDPEQEGFAVDIELVS